VAPPNSGAGIALEIKFSPAKRGGSAPEINLEGLKINRSLISYLNYRRLHNRRKGLSGKELTLIGRDG
jgi:hypothetical protein